MISSSVSDASHYVDMDASKIVFIFYGEKIVMCSVTEM